jgi:hypothetical protein
VAPCVYRPTSGAIAQTTWKARTDDPRLGTEEPVIPPGSLFIEPPPGEPAVLEYSKLFSRAFDVQVRVDLVWKRLEQLRPVARIISEEPGDPHVSKKVKVQGRVATVLPA